MRQRRRPGRPGGGRHAGQRDRGRAVPAGGRTGLAEGPAAAGRGGGWISRSAPPRLAWVPRHEPDRWAAVTRLSMIADWIVFRLTGTLVTEASIGSTSGMFDLGRRVWSPEIMTLCELEPALFPEVVEAGTIAGRVSGTPSRQTGLPLGTPVAAGGLDTA